MSLTDDPFTRTPKQGLSAFCRASDDQQIALPIPTRCDELDKRLPGPDLVLALPGCMLFQLFFCSLHDLFETGKMSKSRSRGVKKRIWLHDMDKFERCVVPLSKDFC